MRKLSTKLFAAFAVIVLLLAVQSAVTISSLRFLKDRINEVVLFSEEIDNIHELQYSIVRLVMPANDYLITGRANEKQLYEGIFKQAQENFKKAHDFRLLTAEEKSLLDKAHGLFLKIDSLSRQILAIDDPVGNVQGAEMMEEMDALADEANEILEEFHDIDHEEIESAIERTNAAHNRLYYIVLISSASILLLAVFLSVALSISIVRPVKTLTEASKYVAEGRYEKVDIPPRKDELGLLVNAFNLMSGQIQKNIASIKKFAGESEKAKNQAFQRETNIRTIAEAGNSISALLDINEILESLLNYSIKLLGANSAAVFLYDREKGTLDCAKCVGFKRFTEVCGLSIRPEDRTPVSESFAKGGWVYCDDISVVDPAHPMMDVIKEEGLVACLSTPLKVRDRKLGVISVFPKTRVRFTPEQIDMFEILSSNVATTINSTMLSLKVVESEKKRLNEEFIIAQNIQKSLLPQSAPVIPNLDIGFMIRQARYIGGDFYDFITIDDKLAVSIGDVSGKSVSAAMLTSLNKYVLRTSVSGKNVLRPVKELNEVLYKETTPDIFVTLIFSLFDARAGKTRFVNAGHVPPLFYNKSRNRLEYVLDKPQIALGINKKAHFAESEFDLGSGDFFVFFTDGVVEARSAKNEFYGYDRLLKVVYKNVNENARVIADNLLDDLQKFSKEELHDDICAVIIKMT